MLFYRNLSQVQWELYLHFRKEALCVTGISDLNSLNIARRLETVYFEDLYNILISIINGNKDKNNSHSRMNSASNNEKVSTLYMNTRKHVF